MENSSIVTTTEDPPTSFSHHQHQYPAHDPTLADHEFGALFSRQNPPMALISLNINITNCNSSGINPTTQPPIAENEQRHSTTTDQFESPESIQNSDHDSSIITERGGTIAVPIGDENQSIELRLSENVLPDIENQIESTTTSMENQENDSSNHPPIATLIITTPHIALFNYMWSLLGVVVSWFYLQNPPASSTISMVNLDSNSSHPSRRAGQNAISNADAGEHAAPPPPFPPLVSPNNQIQDQSSTITMDNGDLDSSIPGSQAAISNQTTHQLSTENVLPDTENQIESTATSMENPENDSSNHPPKATLIATTPHTARLHDYSNPKIATYFVGVYPTFIALVSLKFIAEKYNTPFDTHIPFMIISIVAYLMAILDLAILFCLYDRLKRPSNQHFSPGHYKILTYVFHILWILAILSVVPVLVTPQR